MEEWWLFKDHSFFALSLDFFSRIIPSVILLAIQSHFSARSSPRLRMISRSCRRKSSIPLIMPRAKILRAFSKGTLKQIPLRKNAIGFCVSISSPESPHKKPKGPKGKGWKVLTAICIKWRALLERSGEPGRDYIP